MITLRCLKFAAMLALTGAAAAHAAYPDRPIRMIVAQAPGGNADIIARALAAGMSERLGQTMVVDNRAGGSGIIAGELTVRAAPDGYTVLLVSSAFGVNPAVNKHMSYDQLRDLAPITLIAKAPNVLVVGPALKITTVGELIQTAKARPGQLTFASSGNLGSVHLAGELFKLMAGVDMLHVPYKGASPALVDLMGGRVSMSFASLPTGIPHIRTGRLRGIAVTSEKRFPQLPDLPTISESGLPGFETSAWQGFIAPAATPRAIISRLHASAVAVITQPQMQERLNHEGAEIIASSPEAFWVFAREQIAKWTKVVRAANLTPG
jgi:tripartite-type tricarboxylate transporter receptor subunit TctC